MTRFEAMRALLDLPDDPYLPPRARRYVQAGDPLRRDAIKLNLERAWLRHRAQQLGEEAEIVSVRRTPIRLVRKRA